MRCRLSCGEFHDLPGDLSSVLVLEAESVPTEAHTCPAKQLKSKYEKNRALPDEAPNFPSYARDYVR